MRELTLSLPYSPITEVSALTTSIKGKEKKLKLTDEINSVANEINSILELKQEDRYFEGIAIVHSFVENLLKWLVFTQIVWNRSREDRPLMAPGEVEQIKDYCNRLNFYSLLNEGLNAGLLTFDVFNRLNDIRTDRNSFIHQYWLYLHKGNRLIFRKKLEKLAGAGSDLVGCFNRLSDEIGVALDDSFFDISMGRNFIVL